MRHVLAFVFLSSLPLFSQADVKGSSDHPLFPDRMPGYRIGTYKTEAFSSHRFQTSPPTDIEGKYTRISYYLGDATQHPGALAILRNYENAASAAGGAILFSNASFRIIKLNRGGVETWAQVQASAGRYYFLTIVERTAMAQVITADALAAALNKDGFIALDIRFATGSAAILPESQPQIDQMAAMLRAHPALRVGVEGHTDNVGTPAANKTLSEKRAQSVTAALVAAGTASARLLPAGYGQERPVADNRTEDGRARNRRVELTKR